MHPPPSQPFSTTQSSSSRVAIEKLLPVLYEHPRVWSVEPRGRVAISPNELNGATAALFYIVTAGACLLQVADGSEVELSFGDTVILPRGACHAFRERARRYAAPLASSACDFSKECDAEAAHPKLIGGKLQYDPDDGSLLLEALPDIVVVHADQGGDGARVRTLVEALVLELTEERFGAAAVAASLAGALIAVLVRVQFEDVRGGSGILKLLDRPQTARALAVMLREPSHRWTLDDLASYSGASRASLVRFFRAAVDAAPLMFLANLRLALAKRLVMSGNVALTIIAEDVGYQSQAAFSRAYLRRYSVAPGHDRRRASERRGAAAEHRVSLAA